MIILRSAIIFSLKYNFVSALLSPWERCARMQAQVLGSWPLEIVRISDYLQI
jgi:hypothetical protein